MTTGDRSDEFVERVLTPAWNDNDHVVMVAALFQPIGNHDLSYEIECADGARFVVSVAVYE